MVNLNEDVSMKTDGVLKSLEIEIHLIGNQIQNNILQLGYLILRAKNECKKQGISYKEWCSKNIGMNYINCNRLIRTYETLSKSDYIAKYVSAGFNDGKNSFRKLDAIASLSSLNLDDKGNVIYNKDGTRSFDISDIEEFLKNNPDFLDRSLSQLKNEISKIKQDKYSTEKRLKKEVSDAKIALTVAQTRLKKLDENMNSIVNERVKTQLQQEKEELYTILNAEREKLDILIKDHASINENLTKREVNIKHKEELLLQQQIKLDTVKDEFEYIKSELNILNKNKSEMLKGMDKIKNIKELILLLEQVSTTSDEINKYIYDEYILDPNIHPYLNHSYKSAMISLEKLGKKLCKDTITIIDI